MEIIIILLKTLYRIKKFLLINLNSTVNDSFGQNNFNI